MDENHIEIIEFANKNLSNEEINDIVVTILHYYYLNFLDNIIDEKRYDELNEELCEHFYQSYYNREFSEFLYDQIKVENFRKYIPDNTISSFIKNVKEEYKTWNIL